MSVESPPEWLPNGWIMGGRKTRQGMHEYYISPEDGCIFQSKEEVLNYLRVEKNDSCISEGIFCSDENKIELEEEAKEFPDWLPSGWSLETKTRRSGASAGQKYKCYVDPLTQSRFYSKNEVLRFLKSKKVLRQTSEMNKHFKRNSTDDIVYSPDGLPQGWIRETKFRDNKGDLKKDSCSASAKKLKAQGTGRQCLSDEKLLDSSEMSTEGCKLHDRLLLPNPSHGPVQNVEVTAEKRKDAPETTTLSQHSPVNFESAQPAPNQVANNIEEKVIQEGESNPGPAMNSNGNSNKGVEEAPKVEMTPVKFSLVSNMVSNNHPMGEGVELCLAKQEAPAENGDSSKMKRPKGGFSSRKAKAMKAMSVPRRSSRRLAGVEADPVINSVVTKPARSSKSKDSNNVPKESIHNESLPIQSAVEKGGLTKNLSTINWPDFTETSPFGDSWPDPCIEFAFKTLTGDLPVLDDAITIQEYFEQQLFAVERSSGTALLPDGKVEIPPGSTDVEKLPTEPDLRQRNETTQMVTMKGNAKEGLTM